MPNNSSTTHGEETVVAKHSIGEKIIDSLRNSFTGGGKIRRGDFYMNQSHDLLQRYLRIIDVNERHSIMETYIEAKESKKKFEASSFRYFKAAEYKSLCKETFEIVARASNRVGNNNLICQIAGALEDMGDRPVQPTSQKPLNSQLTIFNRSHELPSALSDVAVHDLSRVEMETYQSEVTGEGCDSILGLHRRRRDAPSQHIFATFSPTVFLNDSRDTVDMHSLGTLTESVIFGPPSTVESEE